MERKGLVILNEYRKKKKKLLFFLKFYVYGPSCQNKQKSCLKIQPSRYLYLFPQQKNVTCDLENNHSQTYWGADLERAIRWEIGCFYQTLSLKPLISKSHGLRFNTPQENGQKWVSYQMTPNQEFQFKKILKQDGIFMRALILLYTLFCLVILSRDFASSCQYQRIRVTHHFQIQHYIAYLT